MATMATSHGLSVLTNSSVKPPLNPKTGLSSSMHERPGPTLGRFSGIFYDDYNDEGEIERDILKTKQKLSFATSADPASLLNLSNLSDEEFYSKLLELKNEQRKILNKCEKIYIEKHNGVIAPTFPDDEVEHIATSASYRNPTFRSETFVDDDGILVTTKRSQSPFQPERSRSPIQPERSRSPMAYERATTPPRAYSPLLDTQTDVSSKPPTGRMSMPAAAKSSLMSPLGRPMTAPIAWSTGDLRQATAGMRRSFGESDDEYIPDDTVSEPYRERDISKTMSKIDDMWHNFSIEDYAPRRSLTERPSSATMTRKEKKAKDESWRHRLTVPEPFTMTMREERKEKKKTKNQIEFEEQRIQREREIEEQCSKKFKAKPVPAHVYLPLYDEIEEQKQNRRQQVRHMSAELLKSQEKPFSFLKREEDRKQHQRFDRDCNQKTIKVEKAQTEFKARPVPKHIFDNSVDDKILEEEEYRKIRMKMRAEELLRSASKPPNMTAREQLKEQKEREQKLKTKKKILKNNPRPKINHDVPDYDNLYRQFQLELQRRKGGKEATITRPFKVETRRPLTSNEKIKLDMERDEENLKENRWPYKMSRKNTKKLGHMSMSLDSIPAKSTKSTDVRNNKTRSKLQQLSQRELRMIEEDRRRRVKEMRMRRTIAERTGKDEPRENPEEKRRQFRNAERARMDEYQKELNEIRDRVNRKPFLFEQESQTNAKNKAEKKFNATLRSVGLDEDFVHSRGSRSASVRDYTDDYDDDDFEDTAVKHRDETYTRRRDSYGSESPVEA